MKNRKFSLTLFLLISLLAFSCDNDDPEPVNEEELITRLVYELNPITGGDAVTFSFNDPDGDGGDPPQIEAGTLKAGTAYRGTITLFSFDEEITSEIEEEDEEHQFFYLVESSEFEIFYADADANGNPIGLSTTLDSQNATDTGTLTIVLRHEPDKNADGVSDGNITNAGGETDIEVTFDVVIEE